jgi:hypothetical protein
VVNVFFPRLLIRSDPVNGLSDPEQTISHPLSVTNLLMITVGSDSRSKVTLSNSQSV